MSGVLRDEARPRTDVEHLKTLCRAVDAMNQIVEPMETGGETISVQALYRQDAGAALGDKAWTGSVWANKRGYSPKYGLSVLTTSQARAAADQLRWYYRGGYALWGAGYDGFSTQGIGQGDIAPGSPWPVPFGVKGPGFNWYYLGDAWAGFDYPDEPTHDAADTVGGTGAPNWVEVNASDFDVYNDDDELISAGWGDNPGSPSGVEWTAIRDGDLFQYYPVALPSFGTSGNYIGAKNSILIEAGVGSAFRGSIFSAQPLGIKMTPFLRSCPDNTIIRECLLGLTLNGFQQTTVAFTNSVVDGVFTPGGGTVDTTHPKVAIALVGKVPKVGVGVLSSRWTVLATSVATTAITPDKKCVIDITKIAQAFIDTIRKREDIQSLAIIPFGVDPDGSIVEGVTDDFDMLEFLRRTCPAFTYDWYLAPGDPATAEGGVPIVSPGDILYQSSGSGTFVQWDSIEVENVATTFTLPDSEYDNCDIYPINFPRAD